MTPATLFNTCYPSLCLYGSSILHDQQAGEDCVMEVFKKLCEGKITIDGNINNRLYTCVKNQCINYLKSRKKYNQPGDTITSENAETLRIKTEVVRQIYDLLLKLPKGQRQAVIGHVLEGKEYKELAEEMGVSEFTLRNQCMQAMKKLRCLAKREMMY